MKFFFLYVSVFQTKVNRVLMPLTILRILLCNFYFFEILYEMEDAHGVRPPLNGFCYSFQ